MGRPRLRIFEKTTRFHSKKREKKKKKKEGGEEYLKFKWYC
jgi:hypothetical protein